jgi:hypothetical protein
MSFISLNLKSLENAFNVTWKFETTNMDTRRVATNNYICPHGPSHNLT